MTLVQSLKSKVNTTRRIYREEGLRKTVSAIYGYVSGKDRGNGSPASIESSENVPASNVRTYTMRLIDVNDYSEMPVLDFPYHEHPDVSIIIPVYNNWGYTYNCLKSIYDTADGCSYEIIIGDDCSSDETVNLEKYVRNVKHVVNTTNLNFLKNCNNASKYARGRYILFLNNDTIVLHDWLRSLYDLIESDDSIGMVGSKFIYPDGTLQEAGGIVWADATGHNYGRGFDPRDAEYNYVRDVDYISGASIMIRRELWDDIGGFDERFSPAYFEDSDLAFSVRDKGFRVVYQPRSELFHFERTTQGEKGLKLCETNRPKFIEKWSKELERDSFPPDTDMFLQRDRGKHSRRMLFIDDLVPMFDQHAGGKTTFNFLKLLVDIGYKVTFAGVCDFQGHQPYTSLMEQMGIEVLYGKRYREDFFSWLNENAKYFETVFLSRPEITIHYIDWFKEHTSCRIAYYGHDLHYLREMREFKLTGNKELERRSNESKKQEFSIMSKSDIVMTVSPEEKEIIDAELGIRSIVTPIFFYRGFDRADFDTLSKTGLLFVGGYNHTPNVDGVKWFVNDVLPVVREKIPDIRLILAGSHPTDEIKAMESEYIHVTGYMDDRELDALYDERLISVVPLRFGAGVKGKTVDAMYHGMPVVSTSIGLEGLPGIRGYLSSFDDAESFADEIIRLYNDREAVKEAYGRNVEYVRTHFSYDSALDTFRHIFNDSHQ